jgi:hypothetical protein
MYKCLHVNNIVKIKIPGNAEKETCASTELLNCQFLVTLIIPSSSEESIRV